MNTKELAPSRWAQRGDTISWKQLDQEHRQDADATWHWLPANDPEYLKSWYEMQRPDTRLLSS
jgi:hypothetical protein